MRIILIFFFRYTESNVCGSFRPFCCARCCAQLLRQRKFIPPSTDPAKDKARDFPVWPSWLRGTKTITGYVAGIDPGKLLVRTLDGRQRPLQDGHAQTKVHVEKTVMSLDDLKDGDPIAVRLKEVKGQGPYAVEIMPHPDVLRRKEKGPDAPPVATELPPTPLGPEPTDADKGTPTLKRAAAAAPAPTQADRSFAVPILPRGQSGITGTIVALNGDDAQLETTNGEKRAVLVTSVTRIVKNGTRDELMERIQVGDRVRHHGRSLSIAASTSRAKSW